MPPMNAHWTRRRLLATTAAVAAPLVWRPRLLLAQAAAPTTYTATKPPYVEVETALGRVRGGHSRGALAFKGIPYAGSVTGAARFKEAPPAQPWTGVRDALTLGPPSMQGPGTTYGENEPAYSENCLVLNVWTPAVKDGRKRPVMVYSHGGGYVTGSGGAKDIDGSRLAANYDVVVVSTNHRLGLLGYLYLGELGGEEYATSGNQGMLDIVAALRWVKTNIEAFGGSPDNVMIFGESGGGFKVGTLLAMPSAKGLFHKASIESGSALRRISKEVATQTARRVLEDLGIGTNELHKLADVPADAFVKMQLQAEHNEGSLLVPSVADAKAPRRELGPVVDGRILPRQPFDPDAPATAAQIPLIVGSNHDEATFFSREHPEIFHLQEPALVAEAHKRLGDNADRILSVYEQAYPKATAPELYIAIATALRFGNDTIRLAERKSAQPAPVYLYRYDYRSNVPIEGTDWTLRAGHATEIAMKFYNYDIPALEGNGPGVAEASKNMSSYWTSFAHTGHPSAAGQPAWPRYDLKRRPTMVIDTSCRVLDDPDPTIRELWASLPDIHR
jgi:para-nitrobenzyl esterase